MLLDRNMTNRAALLPPSPSTPNIDRSLYRAAGDDVLKHRIVVFDAPLGYGKTTALAEWYNRLNEEPEKYKVGWLSVDGIVSKPSVFAGHLLAALDLLWPGVWNSVSLSIGEMSSEDFLLSLSGAVFDIETPMPSDKAKEIVKVLFIDNVDLVNDIDTLKMVLSLTNVLPTTFKVVFSGISFPREFLMSFIEEDVFVYGAGNLALSLEETRQIVRAAVGDSVPESAVDHVYTQTEGWPKGVMLALSCCERSKTADSLLSFCPQNDVVDRFFSSYAEKYLSSELVTFCETISFAEKICTPLCDALTASGEGGRLLSELAKINAFLFSCDARKVWFRFHPLFLGWLRVRLFKRRQIAIENIGWLAADWYESNNDFPNATRSLVLAHDMETLLHIFESSDGETPSAENSPSFLLEQYLRVSEIPSNALFDHNDFCCMGAWTYVFFGRPAEARRCIEVIGNGDISDEDSSAVAPISLECIRTRCLLIEGNLDKALAHSNKLLALVEKGGAKPAFSTAILHTIAQVSVCLGEYDKALSHFHRAKRFVTKEVNLPLAAHCDYEIAQIHLERGDYRQAEKLCSEAMLSCPARHPLYGAFCSLLSRIYTERALFDEALEKIFEAKERVSPNRNPDFYLEVAMAESYYHHILGNEDEAYGLIFEAMATVESPSPLRNIPLRVASLLTSLAYSQGNEMDATFALKDLQFMMDEKEANPTVLQAKADWARRCLLLGKYNEARDCLKELLRDTSRANLKPLVVEAKLMEFSTWQKQGFPQRALSSLKDALLVAAPISLIAPFLVELRAGRITVSDLKKAETVSHEAKALSGKISILFSLEDKKPRLDLADLQTADYQLTAREKEIYGLLMKGFARKEIAEELSISPNTVKAHVNAVYSKLGVSNRSELLSRKG